MAKEINGWPVLDATNLEPCGDLVIELPNGALIHVEYLEGEKAGLSCTGYEDERDLEVDEHMRLKGYEPVLWVFRGNLPDHERRRRA